MRRPAQTSPPGLVELGGFDGMDVGVRTDIHDSFASSGTTGHAAHLQMQIGVAQRVGVGVGFHDREV